MILFFQQGGSVAPYVSYLPVTVTGGSETGTTAAASTDGSSSGSSNLTDKDMLKMLEKLDGLPNDMANLANQLSNFYVDSSFGVGVNTANIATRYLSALSQMKTINFYKKGYDEAFDIVKSNGGLNEVAIAGNLLIAINKEHDVKYINPSEVDLIPEGYHLASNSELLSLRANSPELVGDTGIINLVKNGIGMEAVTKMIKDSMLSLGTDTKKEEGYVRSEKGQILTGLKEFQEAQQKAGDFNATVDNLFKGSYLTKSQAAAANKALTYILSTLPENAKTLLRTKTQHGTLQEAAALVGTLINSNVSNTAEFTMDMDAASADLIKAKRKAEGKDGSDLKSNPLLLMLEGSGGSGTTMQVDIGNGYRMTVNGTYYGQIKSADDKPILDTSMANMIAQSGILSIVNNTKNITFGDLKISMDQLNNITYNNTGCVRTNLPVKSDGSVDLGVLDEYEKAQGEILLLGSSASPERIAQIYRKHNLHSLLKANGELNEARFAPFLVTEGYTTSANKIKDSKYVKEIKDPGEDVFNLIKSSLTTGTGKDKKTPDIDEFNWWNPTEYFGFYDKVYKAAVYIPITTNVNASLIGSNNSVDYDESMQLEALALTLKKRLNVNTNISADLL